MVAAVAGVGKEEEVGACVGQLGRVVTA